MPKHKPPPWLKPKTPPARMEVGVTWYTRDEWARVKAVATDPERFEATFEEWERMAEAALLKFQVVGLVASKVFIDANALLAWCLVHNTPNNASARARFVSQTGAGRIAPGR
jgi:hypothetical protein